ncbi:MAG TPA: BlaI/MecI/CopY family transcriptional regulator [Solirubrobacteraceae bacterium]|nr:BlaI/MecI/CopY family transcriptional regulator [Solirubrobacteraceae bacterium]
MTLGTLERRVMDMLWEQPETGRTVREVADRLPEYAYTTIATVLDRLADKNLLMARRDGRVLRYAAADTRAVHTTLLMQEALSATRDPAAALACFVQSATKEQVTALQDAVERRLHGPSRNAAD